MSSLTGHRTLTRTAVLELVKSSSTDPLLSNLLSAKLPNHAVLRDIYDVISLGHWLNFGQKHHFMRRFDGQTPYSAWQEDVEWIRSNALAAARQLYARIRTKYGPTAAVGPASTPGQPPSAQEQLAGRLVFDGGDGDGVSWQELGNACHALQDSFAGGHAVRLYRSPTPKQPGTIDDILVYADDETYKHEHESLDEGWHTFGNENVLTDIGVLAKDATKELIRMVVRTALAAGGSPPTQLDGWNAFQGYWLAPSPGLVTRDPDAAIRLIRRFSLGFNNGLLGVGHLTFNMDEEGLAKALVSEFGTDLRSVHAAFLELERHHGLDSDDVAVAYVEEVQRAGTSLKAALTNDRALRDKLIQLLEDGWTSGDERTAIRWLESL